MTALLCLLSILSGADGAAVDAVARGNRAYAAGRYDEALAAYARALARSPDAPEILLNKGDALYRQGDFPAAAEAFSRAGQHAGIRLKPRCLYNAGNACFRMAEPLLGNHKPQAVDLLGRAEKLYAHALLLQPDFADARHNLELVRRMRATLTSPPPPPPAPPQRERTFVRLFGRIVPPPAKPPQPPPPVLPRTPEEVLAKERQQKAMRPRPTAAAPAGVKDW